MRASVEVVKRVKSGLLCWKREKMFRLLMMVLNTGDTRNALYTGNTINMIKNLPSQPPQEDSHRIARFQSLSWPEQSGPYPALAS